MGVFEQFPLLTIFLLIVALLLLISTARSRRGRTAAKDVAACPQCGATPPQHARFCNRCGQQL